MARNHGFSNECFPKLAHGVLPASDRSDRNSGPGRDQKVDEDRAGCSPPCPFLVKPYLQLGDSQSPRQIVLVWHTSDGESGSGSVAAPAAMEPRGLSTTGRDVAAAGKRRRPRRSIAWPSREPSRTGSITSRSKIWSRARCFCYRVSNNGQAVFEAGARAPKRPTSPTASWSSAIAVPIHPKSVPSPTAPSCRKPDFVMITGDIVYGKGLASEYRTKYWPIYNSDEASPSVGAPLLRSTLFRGRARQPRHRLSRPGKDAGRPRVFLLLAPAAERPDRQDRQARSPRALARTGCEPESVHRRRRQGFPAHGQFLVRLRQRSLDGPRRQRHGRLDRPRAQACGSQATWQPPRQRPGGSSAFTILASIRPRLTSTSSTCGSLLRYSRRARSTSSSTGTSTTTSGPTRSDSLPQP